MRDHAAADAYLRGVQHTPFDWQHHNCCTFCEGFVRAFTGRDFSLDEARVSDVRAALRAVKVYGGLAGAVTSRLGQPKAPLLAQYGDVVLFSGTEGVGDSIGICVGANVLVPGQMGLGRAPLERAALAWSLPLAPSS